ncbi:crotonobetaine/carnitine-CoA ligase [Litorivivens lipolytica]|uniref:Crotonobetaine/carnitine-CoA ligase n=1 Tax=Litorivivens lipolytica TaxID=1524264 RepID=A0A7W4W4W7_9GAMM|nr:AMP-binding protein [Litorivivens lipolytica]MBB3046932.1 crotonobetaine/carnitine-CoA ligase [Litorivivens lipolytica]
MVLLDYTVPENRVLGNILAHYAAATPDVVFLRAEDRCITYASAFEKAKALAAGMQARGLARGERLCLYLSSSPDFVLLAFAANLAGVHWIPVNTDYRGLWLQETLDDSEPSLVITDADFRGRLDDVTLAAPVLEISAECQELVSDRAFEAPDIDYGDTASIMWTSGTTGKSKGVMQSHNAWVRSALSAAEMGGVSAGDVTYNCLPLYNSAAWVTGIYPALVTGTTCAMDPVFSASIFWERTRFYQASHVFTLGAMHMFLWNAPPADNDADNPVRSAQMVPMPDAIREPFKKRFGINAIHQGFGQSEIMLLMRRYDDNQTEWPPNSLGTPADDIEVALLDENDQPVPVGEPGEICVREKSPHVLFNGYFRNPKATEQAFHNGWYHTGDLLKQDEAGHFYFVDRKKDLIRYKGRSVSSVAIESIARSHPAIANVAVYGVTSAELESEHEIMLAAVVAPGQSLSEEALARFINQNAPYFFVPRYIEFMSSLPMTPTQKVQKNPLRERGVSEQTWDAKAAQFEVER